VRLEGGEKSSLSLFWLGEVKEWSLGGGEREELG